MSDVIVVIYLVVFSGLITALLFHKGIGHKRIFSILMMWTILGIFVSSVGGLIMHGTFTPNMATYNQTSADVYNMFTWGGIAFPEYNEALAGVNNLGIVINAMGLGILVMTMLAGYFPRSFFVGARSHQQKKAH